MKKIILTFAIFFISLVGFGQTYPERDLIIREFSSQNGSHQYNLTVQIHDNLSAVCECNYYTVLSLTGFEIGSLDDFFKFDEYMYKFVFDDNGSQDNAKSIDGNKILMLNENWQFDFTDVLGTSSINENVVTDLRVYPNPSTDYINIDFNSHNEVSITIYSIDGKVMYNTNTYQSETINIQDYPKGMYIVRVNDEMKKIIKQ